MKPKLLFLSFLIITANHAYASELDLDQQLGQLQNDSFSLFIATTENCSPDSNDQQPLTDPGLNIILWLSADNKHTFSVCSPAEASKIVSRFEKKISEEYKKTLLQILIGKNNKERFRLNRTHVYIETAEGYATTKSSLHTDPRTLPDYKPLGTTPQLSKQL